jgi:hypothetical protein
MNVIFDIWILNPNHEKGYTKEEELIFKTAYEFVYDRVVYLYDEITDEEEKTTSPKPPCILVEFKRRRISFHGYSERLIEKLKGSFNENDGELLAQRFDKAFDYLS